MTTIDNLEEAAEILKQLGLKEYEARCFVGLSQLSSGTAKTISEITEVPRTRVYDSVRVLESNGLVEVHHSSPKQFRAVSIDEATEILREQHEARVDRLQGALDELKVAEPGEKNLPQQIWAMSGLGTVEVRMEKLIQTAEDEIVLIVGHESVLTPRLVKALNNVNPELDLIIGALSESLRAEIHDHVPEATTFISGLEWLQNTEIEPAEVAIGRLVLADRSVILLSTVDPETESEHAIFGEGFGNGLVVITRRLLSQGLLDVSDPGVGD